MCGLFTIKPIEILRLTSRFYQFFEIQILVNEKAIYTGFYFFNFSSFCTKETSAFKSFKYNQA
jgi:hypothetical protein